MDDLTGDSHLADLVQALHRCSRQVRNLLSRQLADCQLTDSEFLLLWACEGAREEPLTQAQAAEVIGLSPAQMSGLVERLRGRQVLEVIRSQADRRRHHLRVTESGCIILAQALGALQSTSRQLDAWLTEAELHRLLGLTRRLSEGLAQRPAFDASDWDSTGSSAQGGAAA